MITRVRSLRATIIGLVLASLLLLPGTALAIDNPDLMEIVSIKAYESLIEEDDMTFVIYYRIDYTVVPEERATEAFLGRFLDGTTELQSDAPYAYVNKGYSDGVLSFYFSSAQVNDFGLEWEGSYTIRLQGSPSLFAVPPVVNSGSIQWTNRLITRTRFKEDIFQTARDLEVTWSEFTSPDIELVQETPDGTAFTTEGDDYFTNSIPNLRVMAPDLFSGRVVAPNFNEREHSRSYAEQLAQFWEGTSFGENFNDLAALLNMCGEDDVCTNSERLLLTTLMLVAFNLFIAYVSFHVTQRYDFAPLTVAVIWPVGAYLGMTDIVLAGLMAAAAALGTVYILYLKRA